MAGQDWKTATPLGAADTVAEQPRRAAAPSAARAADILPAAEAPAPLQDEPAPASEWSTLTARLEEAPWSFDFFQAVRRIECARPELPPIGESLRPAQDPVRFGQGPSLAFAPSTLQEFIRNGAGAAPRLMVSFLGFLGPNGPLPHHLTEYARDRERNNSDPSLTRFLDLFNHRIISLFYRAWASNHQAVSFERSGKDRFADYFASLIGLGMPSLRDRDEVSDIAKLHFCGRLSCQTKNAEGLRAILEEYYGVQCRIEEFVGQWINVPRESLCRLGESPQTGALGKTVIVGSHVWDCQQKFRIRMGPLSLRDYQRLLPDGKSFRRLRAWVRNYVGDEFSWDVQLVLKADEVPTACLGKVGQLGWTTWMNSKTVRQDKEDLVLQPEAA